jgi:molecular chaperone DnaK (HSP70)
MSRYDTYEEVSFMTLEFSSVALESQSDLVVGIDFGTTFTGVAYAHSGQIIRDDATRAAEKVEVIKSWPSANLAYTEKTASVIAYNTNPPTWGGSVKQRDHPQVAHFKLGLQQNASAHYLGRASGSLHSALSFLDPNWKHPQLPQKAAVDYAADYLTCIHKYVKDVFFPRQFGSVFLRNQQISYVITVPAIWKDAAKALTRQAAVRAGIPERKLELITEPEAAALYCATICHEVDLTDGDRFLVCDAGGGTVVFPTTMF